MKRMTAKVVGRQNLRMKTGMDFEAPSIFIAGRPEAALLFWFFGEFRCGVSLFIVILVIYKYRNR